MKRYPNRVGNRPNCGLIYIEIIACSGKRNPIKGVGCLNPGGGGGYCGSDWTDHIRHYSLKVWVLVFWPIIDGYI